MLSSQTVQEDGGNTILRNVENKPDYSTASYFKRRKYLFLLLEDFFVAFIIFSPGFIEV
jgi:hypothetical protein